MTSSTSPPTSAPRRLSDDPIAAWPEPRVAAGSLDDLPHLLPSMPIPGVDDGVRSESEGEPTELFDFVQIWIGAGGTRRLVATTNVAQAPASAEGDTITIEPWDQAFFSPSAPEYTILRLADPSGYVVLNGQNLSRDVVERAARAIRPRSGSAGWDLDLAGLELFHEGWSLGPAVRGLDWFDGGRRVAEISIYEYNPGAIELGFAPETEVSLVDIGGSTAVVADPRSADAPDPVTVSWSPSADVTVTFAATLPVEDTLGIVRSIGPVDRATWESVSRPAPQRSDGCQSLVC